MPTSKLKKIVGMDGYSDPATLQEGVVRLIENMFPDKGGLYTREGNAKNNAIEIPGSSGIFGLGEIYSSAGVRRTLAISAGKLYSGVAGTYSEEVTGLHATNPCQILPFQDKALINDQSSGLYVMTQKGGDAVSLVGLPSPKTTKLISSFEDVTAFVVGSGSKVANYSHFIHGTQSIKFTNDTGVISTIDCSGNLVLGNTAVFDDGSLSIDDDYISFFVIVDNPSQVTTFNLLFGSGGVNYLTTNLLLSKEWRENTTPSSGITIRVRKSDFEIEGTPDWDVLDFWGFDFGSTTGIASIVCDYLRLEKAGPLVYEENKIIARIQPDEAGMTYTFNTSTYTWTPEYTARDQGGVGLSITDAADTIVIDFDTPINLNTFESGSVSVEADNIQIYLGKTKLAGAPTVNLKFHHDLTVGATVYFELGALLSPNMVNSLGAFTIPKADFHKDHGTGADAVEADWSSITKIEIIYADVTVTTGAKLFIDEISLVKYKGSLDVNPFQSTETWAVSSGTDAITWNIDPVNLRSDEGSSQSAHIIFKSPAGVKTGSILQQGLTLNLSVFSTNVNVANSDEIGLWAKLANYKNFKSITLEVGDTDFATYQATKTFSQDEILALVEYPIPTNYDRFNRWFNLKGTKETWVETGAMNWAVIQDLKVSWELEKSQAAADFYLDAWTVTRGEVLNGVYIYKVVYVSKNGERSDGSLPSDIISFDGAVAYLKNLPLPGGTNIVSREIYRFGGTSDQWQLVGTIEDITTTTYLDTSIDSDLGASFNEVEGQPYIPKVVVVCDDIVVIGNLTTKDGITYPCGIQVSSPNSCDVFPTNNFFEIDTGRNKIVWMYWIFGRVFVGKEDSIWKFDPNDLSKPPERVTTAYGGISLLGVDGGEDELYFLDSSGVICYNNSYFDLISDTSSQHLSSIANYFDLIPEAYLGRCWIKYYDGLVIVGLVQTGLTYPTKILVWDTQLKIWIVITSINDSWFIRCASSYKTVTEGETLLFGHATTGFIYEGLKSGSDVDVSSAGVSDRIASVIWLGDRDWDEPEQGKDYEKLYLFCKKLTSTNATLAITIYVDGNAFTTTLNEDYEAASLSINSLVHKKFEVPGIQLNYFPSYLGLRLDVSDRWQFRSLVEKIRYEGAK